VVAHYLGRPFADMAETGLSRASLFSLAKRRKSNQPDGRNDLLRALSDLRPYLAGPRGWVPRLVISPGPRLPVLPALLRVL
jgi:hypothetical protein